MFRLPVPFVKNPLSHRAGGWLVLALLLGCLVGLGLAIHDDYGVSWDEENNALYGNITLDYAQHFFGALDDAEYQRRWSRELAPGGLWDPEDGQFAKTHGPFFEVLLILLERALDLGQIQDKLLLRHLGINLIFCLCVGVFVLFVRHLLGSWRLGLIGGVLMVLSPRIFSHAFHNSMDIPFMTAYAASTYTMLRYLEERTFPRAALHALACAVLIASRVAGIIIPVITAGFFVVELLASWSRDGWKNRANFSFLLYAVATPLLVICLWPVLWTDPVGTFFSSFEVSANDPWLGSEKYMGQMVEGTKVPWHFTPVWMLITTPPLYALLVLPGLWSMASAWGGVWSFYRKNRGLLICLSVFLAPLVAVAVLCSTLFNGWRHLYFVYPGFLALSLAGLAYLWRRCDALSRLLHQRIAKAALAGAVVLSVLFTGAFMIRSHPHQLIYFNAFVGGPARAQSNYQIGYWGIEYKEAIEVMLKNLEGRGGDHGIFMSHHPNTLVPVIFNLRLFPQEVQDRFRTVNEQEKARFFMSNHCSNIPQYDFEELWSRRVDGVRVVTLYLVKRAPPPGAR